MIIESAGPRGEVLKLMPALTIEAEVLDRGLGIIAQAVAALDNPKEDVR